MTISNIHLAALRNNEHLNHMNEVKQLIAEQTAAALNIVNQTDNFLQALLLEEEASTPTSVSRPVRQPTSTHSRATISKMVKVIISYTSLKITALPAARRLRGRCGRCLSNSIFRIPACVRCTPRGHASQSGGKGRCLPPAG